MWPAAITDPFYGKTSLWKVFWAYGLGTSIAYSIVRLVAAPATPIGLGVDFVLTALIGILQGVMLWQCAPNSPYPFVGRLVRGALVLTLLLSPFLFYLLWTHPESLVPPNQRLQRP